jgi:glycosyltransferase involved in cell wall biosynthesis
MTKIVHVLPSTLARGAQLYARALVDILNDFDGQSHTLVSLYGGSSGIPVDIALGGDGGESPAAGFDPVVALRLHRYVRKHAPDVLVAHGGDPLKFLVGSFNRPPVVYHAIGTVGPSVRAASRRRLWTWLLGKAEVVAAVSEDVARECRDLLGVTGGKLTVVPNGRDESRFKPRDPAADAAGRRPVLLFVGRLTEGKRPRVFIDLVASLRRRGHQIEAWLVGDGPLAAELETSAREAGVEMLGERADVPELMRNADLFVFPSLPEGEGMPGVLIEAGLSGLAVVATEVPGARSVVEEAHTGCVVDTADLVGLCDTADRLLSDPGRLRAMGAAARSRCEAEFTMDASALRWRDLLDDLCRR